MAEGALRAARGDRVEEQERERGGQEAVPKLRLFGQWQKGEGKESGRDPAFRFTPPAVAVMLV